MALTVRRLEATSHRARAEVSRSQTSIAKTFRTARPERRPSNLPGSAAAASLLSRPAPVRLVAYVHRDDRSFDSAPPKSDRAWPSNQDVRAACSHTSAPSPHLSGGPVGNHPAPT